jgi:two-component system NtrC family response regulator
MKYSYPGNIRELENLIERAVALAREDLITTAELPPGLSRSTDSDILDPTNLNDPYGEKVAAFEKTLLRNALEMKSGNQSKAAALLGMTERHLRSRMQILGMINPEKKNRS